MQTSNVNHPWQAQEPQATHGQPPMPFRLTVLRADRYLAAPGLTLVGKRLKRDTNHV
jgi:hypothetical protein